MRTRRRGRARNDDDDDDDDDGEDFFLFLFFAFADAGGDADTGGEGRTKGVRTDQEGARGVSRRERRVLRGGVRDGRRRETDDGDGDVCEVERGVRAGVSGVLGGAL